MTRRLLIVLLSLVMVLSVVALVACDEDAEDITGAETEYFTVTFDSNGGSSISSQSVASGSTATKPADPTLDGYTFDGWYASSSSTAFDFSTAISADTTLTAQWTVVSYTVTFDTNIGTAVGTETVTHGSTATEPTTDPTLEGYTFVGWVDSNGAAFDFDTAISADTTITAKFYTDGLEYTLSTDEDSYEVVGMGTAEVEVIIIPDSYNNLPVTSIGYCAFEYEDITSAYIGSSITYIDYYVFYDCQSLVSIVVDSANTVYQSIDGNLYSKDGTVLYQYAAGKTDTSFVVPDSVVVIFDGAISCAYNLTSVTLGNSVKTVDNYAFYYCTSLTSVTFATDSQLETIGYSAFEYTAIDSIVIPDTVTYVDGYAFHSTSGNIFLEGSATGWATNWNTSFTGTVYSVGSWDYVDGVPTPNED